MQKKKFSVIDALFVLGAVLISLGVGLWVCLEAGLVTSGLFCLVGSYLTDASVAGKDEDK